MKKFIRIAAVLALLLLAAAAYFYFKILSPPVVPSNGSPVSVYIPTGSTYQQVLDSLVYKGLVKDRATFTALAERMAYKRNPMRAGHFVIDPGTPLLDMIRLLRNGKQTPIVLVLNNEREPMNVAAKAARFIEPDSLGIVSLLQNRAYLDSIGYTPQTLMTIFIPNSYEFFWNTTPRGFVERMIKEHDRFWDADGRREKARQLNLSPAQVYTLASIVEKETQQNSEKKRMAGVYLNRLRIGMRLQADPTCVFATRDFYTKRVLEYHLKFDSPYNTYLYAGLPPGPIAMSSIASIDAVLNPESHDYLYFCARGDETGLHNYAQTLQQHNKNIEIYVANLKERGLR